MSDAIRVPPASPALERALLALEGLALGDAFGEIFFSRPHAVRDTVAAGQLPPGPWWYTDDTAMAIAVYEVLRATGRMNQDLLALKLVMRYREDPGRGYGKMTRRTLEAVARRGDWRSAAAAAFSGAGSMGNGAPARVAPLGAFFAEDLDEVVRGARESRPPDLPLV